MTAELAHDTQDRTENPIANVNVYWKVSGLALTAVALLGITVNALGGNYAYTPDIGFMESFLVFDWTHNILHVALAGLALAFGFGSFNRSLSLNMAKIIGITYIGLGVLGFVPAVTELLDTLLALRLEAGENLIHLTLGAWGAYAGFTG